MNLSINVKIKDIQPMTVAFISVKGHYEQIPTAFGKLYNWVAQKGYKPVCLAIAVYYNIPGQVRKRGKGRNIAYLVFPNVELS